MLFAHSLSKGNEHNLCLQLTGEPCLPLESFRRTTPFLICALLDLLDRAVGFEMPQGGNVEYANVLENLAPSATCIAASVSLVLKEECHEKQDMLERYEAPEVSPSLKAQL